MAKSRLRILVGRFFKLRRRNTRGIPSAPTLIPEAESLDDSAIVDHAIETTVACAIETTGAMDLKGSDTVVDPDSKCFDDLPEDVILAIIFHVDERTLWIIMQLSHSIAQKAKTAVIPYLRERVIVGQPKMFTSSKLDPLSLNVYMVLRPVNPDFSPLATNLRNDLVTSHSVAERHMELFDAGDEPLRQLTIELRTDDRLGWDFIGIYGSGLVSLEIQMYDLRCESSIKHYSHFGDEGELVVIDADNETHLMDTIEFGYSLDFGRMYFANLTTLTISSTAHTFCHFAMLVDSVPNVQTLTLNSHWSGAIDPNASLSPLAPFSTHLPSLRNVTISGDEQSVMGLVRTLLADNDHILYLTVHIFHPIIRPDWSVSDSDADRCIGWSIASCKALLGLAVYGPGNGICLSLFEEFERQAETSLLSLEILVVESGAFSGGTEYPVLDQGPDTLGPGSQDQPDFRPHLPALKHLICFDRQVDRNGKYTLGRPTTASRSAPTGSTRMFYEDYILAGLFEHYSTLETVRFIAGYPANPFGPFTDSSLYERFVECYMKRADDGAEGQTAYRGNYRRVYTDGVFYTGEATGPYHSYHW